MTGNLTIMFIVGFIIFIYLVGLVTMISKHINNKEVS